MSWLSRMRNAECGMRKITVCTLHFCISALLLTACGFQPLYGKKTDDAKSKLMAGIKIDSIAGRSGQQFKIALEDRLNPPGGVHNPTYRLNVTLVSNETAIGVARDNTVSRYNMYLTSHYTLYRIADNKAVTSGDLTYVNSYNNLANAYFSTYTAQGDATSRGLVELSELYRQRLSAYLDAGALEQDIKEATPALGPITVSPDPERNKALAAPVFK